MLIYEFEYYDLRNINSSEDGEFKIIQVKINNQLTGLQYTYGEANESENQLHIFSPLITFDELS